MMQAPSYRLKTAIFVYSASRKLMLFFIHLF